MKTYAADDLWAGMVTATSFDIRDKTVTVDLSLFDPATDRNTIEVALVFSGVTQVRLSRRNDDPWEAVELTEFDLQRSADLVTARMTFFGDADTLEVVCRTATANGVPVEIRPTREREPRQESAEQRPPSDRSGTH